ncbi:hypothetical protein RE474_04690 [Methanolobus sediminis]|uniref:Uncharacterized protein n=1 Tax=Methanolobus sediminis TaxID=3072978 RepID=A0AA51YML1_9EURY|nr:hypothetical protein [Methanolobus sediminis]WMW26022.1 hypothetical protein RE474_04690 [Methanolobus sediminis]
MILVALTCISLHPAVAGSNPEQVNATIVADLQQTVGEDLLSLVDTDVYEGYDENTTPYFNVIWSPDGDQMLIQTSVFLHMIGGGDFGSAIVYALYIADADGSDLKCVVWGESKSSEGLIIRSPVWSSSGDYFAYVEESTGGMYRVKSSQLGIMSNDLQPVHRIDQDLDVSGSISEMPVNYKWSPVEDKIITFIPGNLVVYNLEDNTNFSLDIGDNYFKIKDVTLSGDGSKLVFSMLEDNYTKIHKEMFLVDIETRDIDQIYSVEGANFYFVKWSPDSKKLSFTQDSLSEGGGTLLYVLSFNDMDGEKPAIIPLLDYGIIEAWYPDSERLLVSNGSSKMHELFAVSINGEIEKLFRVDSDIDTMLSENGCVLVICRTLDRDVPSRMYNLTLLSGQDQMEIDNVYYYSLEGNDLIFVSDSKISYLNTATNEAWSIPTPIAYPETISLNPSGYSIAVDGYIMELQGLEDQAVTSIGNDTYSSVPDGTDVTTEISQQSETENNDSIASFINEKVDAFFGAVTEILGA